MLNEMTATELARKAEKASRYYEPTSEDVRACWEHFSKKYGTKLIDKHNARLMKFIALFLSMGGMKKEDFLNRYVTTIGKKIYVPFEIGVPGEDGRWSLWSQMLVCVHEHCHVDQYKASDTKSAFDFSRQYLLKKRRRTRFEVEAYTTGLELFFWRFGQRRDHKPILETLRAYRVGDLDLEVADKALEMNNKMVSKGAVMTKATAEFVRWMESRGVLRHS